MATPWLASEVAKGAISRNGAWRRRAALLGSANGCGALDDSTK